MSKGGRAFASIHLLVSVTALCLAAAALWLVVSDPSGADGTATDGVARARPSVDEDAAGSQHSPPRPDGEPPRNTPRRVATVTADVTARCLPAVVNVSTRRVSHAGSAPAGGNPFFDLLRPFLGGGGPRESRSLGSGVIVDDGGVVLTNHHVVSDATEIRVTLSNGREYAAVSVGSDPESDVAVLRLRPEDGEALDLQALPYGNSTDLRQGDSVLAIGNPFGVGQTVTMGIVSATGRAAMGIADYEDFIQTDAAINPGNSGGALINLRGELVGINTAILSRTGGSHGIGFAIPSNMARPVAEALLRDGHVTRGWLGVALQDLSPQLARSLGIRGAAQGVVVMHVEASGPAAGVDLRRGDQITQLDAETIRSSRQLRNLLATRGAGTAVRLVRVRGGQPADVAVTLAERPELQPAEPVGDAQGALHIAGLTLAPLSGTLRARYSIGSGVSGAAVVGTDQSGPGPSAGLQVGDVIVQAAGQPVDSPETFRRLFEGSLFVAMIQVQRGGVSRVFFLGR